MGAPLFRLLLRPVRAANLLGECECEWDEPGGGVADVEPPWENLAAYLLRMDTFLKSSAASDSEEKAIPIMQSCSASHEQVSVARVGGGGGGWEGLATCRVGKSKARD